MQPQNEKPLVAIACGGTGGHLFPGIAVADQLVQLGCDVTLLVSSKKVDQEAVQSARGVGVFTLPAVASGSGRWAKFFVSSIQSWRTLRRLFERRKPQAVLAMGGFTSAPPIIAGRQSGAFTCLHDSNTIPGRANRWLAHVVDQAYVGFPGAAQKLKNSNIVVTGTPVRPDFKPGVAELSRAALGFSEHKPVLLVMGGSQGASGINELVVRSLPLFKEKLPGWQYLHLTGSVDNGALIAAYAKCGLQVVVRPFLAEMHLALGAATAAISRAGASSLAELAATQLPSILIPFPHAADNHQYFNAQAYVETGAALMLEQRAALPEQLVNALLKLDEGTLERYHMMEALATWRAPFAAKKISQQILAAIESRQSGGALKKTPPIPAWTTPKMETETILVK